MEIINNSLQKSVFLIVEIGINKHFLPVNRCEEMHRFKTNTIFYFTIGCLFMKVLKGVNIKMDNLEVGCVFYKIETSFLMIATCTIDHMATRCEKMLGHCYMRRYNEIVKYIRKKLKAHKVQQIFIVEIGDRKIKKYDLIIPYVLTWDGIKSQIELNIQSVNLKKTLESVSMEDRRGGDLILAENKRNENLHTK
ncbi:hypothetical protein NAPIS_ORF01444 [Vairimorpha apis BRL 01]|uniref:Uncharacterized protein n=1 Tax=Vairimorpha apis BRL 01 TaxID=1037528 RepID=T0MCT9_9MICR|nr:hypothetical protein NAPIS_ORF01444 [Vairimorpha apis BRL 01]